MPSTLSLNTNEQAAQIALIENTHREALNPISEARAMQRLADEFQYTHDEVAVLLGISRTQVTNLIRLLRLDARIQHWMKQGALSEGHGKVLAGLPLENQYWYAHEAIKKEWTVRALDEAIKTRDSKKPDNKRQQTALSALFEQQLAEQFGYPIKISVNKNESGHFRIAFNNQSVMQEILFKLSYKDPNETT
jgi:ParB family chromosome partitioning protein